MAAAPLKLASFLPYRLSVLTNRVSRSLARLYEDRFGLTVPEWRVLAVLGEEDGLSAGEVAQRTTMDKVAVSRAVRRLVEAGRLRSRRHAADQRRSELHLSARGRAVYAEIVPLARDFEAKLLATLEPELRATLRTLLDRLDALAAPEDSAPAEADAAAATGKKPAAKGKQPAANGRKPAETPAGADGPDRQRRRRAPREAPRRRR